MDRPERPNLVLKGGRDDLPTERSGADLEDEDLEVVDPPLRERAKRARVPDFNNREAILDVLNLLNLDPYAQIPEQTVTANWREFDLQIELEKAGFRAFAGSNYDPSTYWEYSFEIGFGAEKPVKLPDALGTGYRPKQFPAISIALTPRTVDDLRLRFGHLVQENGVWRLAKCVGENTKYDLDPITYFKEKVYPKRRT